MACYLLTRTLPVRFVLGIAVLGGLLNATAGTIVHALQIPVYLDSILTIIVTLHFGLFPGLITALVTNGILAITDQVLFPFVCCNIATALLSWWFVSHRWLNRASGFIWLGIAIALANGILGSTLSYYLYSGVTMVHGIDRLVTGLVVTGQSLLTAVFWSGMITNLLDKLVSTLCALGTRRWISNQLHRGIENTANR